MGAGIKFRHGKIDRKSFELGLNVIVSAIRELANSVMGTDDLIALWFGEPDVPTAKLICDALQKEGMARFENYL